MPPRFSYWTIIAGGLPTAFRAADRDELLPTFQRIRERHPDAQMKWFARGKLWESPEAARTDQDHRARRAEAASEARRNRAWRPGGEHRDPRQRFKDAKRARNQEQRKRRFEQRHDGRPGGALRSPKRKPQQDPFDQKRTRPQGFDRRGMRDGRDRGPSPQGGHDRERPLPNAGPARKIQAREKTHGDPLRKKVAVNSGEKSSRRPFGRDRFARSQGPHDPEAPPPTPRPSPEPHPSETREPTPPPRPNEPVIAPPGPPERGKKR